MTKEEIEHNHIKEIAEEYIKKNNLEWELECNRTSSIGEVKQAYLAGLKAGRPKWHKDADGDLPKRDVRFSTAVSIPVLTQDYKFACYYFSSLKWYSQGEEVRVIAWYEIPQYTDKE